MRAHHSVSGIIIYCDVTKIVNKYNWNQSISEAVAGQTVWKMVLSVKTVAPLELLHAYNW